ncbi:MAG: hypothetical protein K2P51_02705 [Rhabdochlamydiaceae bacterium]|nr:hypothetical protein [Rhabdochlamydiaceae bacterium]
MGRIFQTTALTLASFLSFSIAQCAYLEEQTPNPKEIRVVPKEPTPEPDHVTTKILFPRKNEVETSAPVKGQIRIDGFALGVDSDFPRKKEIYNDNEGQSLHIVIDNQPYFSVNEALLDSLDDVEEYFDQTAEYEIPFKLQPGMHVMRVFPVRSFNESLKGDNCFAAIIFYYKQKKSDSQVDLSQPFLTYNEPQGEYSYNNGQPILLDFYLTNCELSKDGYKVRLSIDNANVRTLVQWVPHYLYGLSKGMHTIRLELLDKDNQPVPGYFNDIQRTFTIK